MEQKLKQKQKLLEEQKLRAEKEAFQKIAAATEAGIKAGEEASRKLHADAKVQSEEQTAVAVERLKNKFDSTKRQVMDIVNNFGKIHSELQDLRSEYIQEQSSHGQDLVQTGDHGVPPQVLLSQLDSEEKLLRLKTQLKDKQAEILEIVQDFRKIHADLYNIKNHFEKEKHSQQVELSMLKNQEADTRLSQLFEKQSDELHNKRSVQGKLEGNLSSRFEI